MADTSTIKCSKLYIVQYFSFFRCIALPNIPTDARWNQLGVNIAGSKWKDNETAQRKSPRSLFIDEDQTVIIADMNNDRIIQYKVGDENGQIIAGGNGRGNQTNQLNRPSDVLVDSITNSLIICDRWNKRIIRWPRYTDTKQGEILLINIHCWGLAIDDQRYLYISDTKHHEIRRYRIGETKGIIAAGGHKSGTGLHQLNRPTYLFIDLYKNIYISDSRNQRVMKWMENATEGIIIAASTLEQRILPRGLFVDALETLYMVDAENHRIMRWPKESSSQGTRNYREVNLSLQYPWDLSFDQYCNLYITDLYSFQIQRFPYEYIYQKI